MSEADPSQRRSTWVVAAVALVTIAVYWPALGGEFLWDDHDNITAREVIKQANGIGRIWTDVHSTQQYYPLTHTTFWLQYQLFGENTIPYHVLNLVLHGLGSWLVWRVLAQLRVPAAGLAAALFAVHPLHVESVAWITERKNVLSLPLALLSAWAYFAHHGLLASSWSERRGRFATWLVVAVEAKRPFGPLLWLSLGCFVLALLAKTSISVLPAALLLCLCWKRGWPGRMQLLELLPFFVLGIGAGALTAWLEVSGVSAHGRDFDYGPVEKLLRAARIYWFYPGRLVYPLESSFMYPRWEIDVRSPWAWGFVLLLLGALVWAAAWAKRRSQSGPLVALLVYGVLIFPALGFFNVAFMRWSFVQDHFCYAASIPALALLASGLQCGLGRLGRGSGIEWGQRGQAGRGIGLGLGAVLCATLGALAFTHAERFSSYRGLFEHALIAAPESWLINHNLALLYHADGRLDDAAKHYQTALRSNPELATSHNNLGAILFARGDFARGLEHLRRAAELEPENQNYRGNYAQALAGSPDAQQAVSSLREMVAQTPDWVMGQRLLAWVLATSPEPSVRNGAEAVALSRSACERTRLTRGRCLFTLAAAYAEAGDVARAASTAKQAAELARAEGKPALAVRYAEQARAFAAGDRYRAKPGESE